MLRHDIILISIVLAVVVGFALVAIRAPIRVRLNNWQSADSGFELCMDNYVAPDVGEMIAALRQLGFIDCGHWQCTGHSRATGQITLMENPLTLDVAKILVTAAGTRRAVTLLFQTQFQDGTEIATANNQLTVGLPSLPGITALWLPEVRDPIQLYRIHDQVRDLMGLGMKRVSVGPDPAAYLTAGRNRMLAHFVVTGYYYLDEARGVYRPTWKGALLMTWRLLWPIRPLYRAWRRRRTREFLREHGLQLEFE
jgi:hypothetical protein